MTGSLYLREPKSACGMFARLIGAFVDGRLRRGCLAWGWCSLLLLSAADTLWLHGSDGVVCVFALHVQRPIAGRGRRLRMDYGVAGQHIVFPNRTLERLRGAAQQWVMGAHGCICSAAAWSEQARSNRRAVGGQSLLRAAVSLAWEQGATLPVRTGDLCACKHHNQHLCGYGVLKRLLHHGSVKGGSPAHDLDLGICGGASCLGPLPRWQCTPAGGRVQESQPKFDWSILVGLRLAALDVCVVIVNRDVARMTSPE